MRKKIFVTSMISLFSANAVFAETNIAHNVAIEAVNRVKSTQDYGKITMDVSNNKSSTLRIPDYKLQIFEEQFILAVDRDWTMIPYGDSGFVQYLQADDQKWLVQSQNPDLLAEERAKYIIWDRFYIRFTQLWSNPSLVNTIANNTANNTYYNTQQSTNQSNTTSNWNRTFSQVMVFTTVSGKTYTIRKSNDNQYRFNQTSKYGFSSQSQIVNFLDQQNRIIYTAPNGRRYGIFRIDGQYHFNRDNGSVSVMGRTSLNGAKQYINGHN